MAQNYPLQMGMGGGGQMMQNQQRQQQPQLQNAQQQIQSFIYQSLSENPQVPEGWQQQVLIQERIALIFNM